MDDLTGTGREKGGADSETSNDGVQVVRQHKGKSKKGKGKCKSSDLFDDSPIRSPSATAHDRYYRVLDGLEMLVSRKKSSNNSMCVSVSSLSKNQHGFSKAKSKYEVALDQFSELHLPWTVHVKMGDTLKNEQELALWFTAKCDEGRLFLLRMQDCFPSEQGNQTGLTSWK